ncbi:acyl transferase/acyl hydrolase/lysophospholipase [Cladorrhinum sp. PSN259]|nr:acyl transferase/acyl hydrolase/lysophospholipase [Cladorrhinum sp. PSN259]
MADQELVRGPWDKVNVLTFDGGGVRGYYSLLHLDKLMECIAEEEHRLNREAADDVPPEALSSFSPHPMPEHVNHRSTAPPVQASFLPCHYFDYISGTSTGALISIMLGRFRMSTYDCLGEYERLAGRVFGQPRKINEMTFLGMLNLTKRNKFSTTNLELAIKDVVRRRGEKAIHRDSAEDIFFGTLRGTCRAMVFIRRTTLSSEGASLHKPYIFRSYDNFRLAPNPGGHPQPARTSDPNAPKHTRRSTTLPVWKLARAATAAQFYFKPLLIALDDSEVIRNSKQEKKKLASGNVAEYTDAGVDRVNNPSQAVYKELRTALTHSKKIETWVSVGTARGTKKDERRLLGFLKSKIHAAGDTEEVDAAMREASVIGTPEYKGPFNYYRLNDSEGLPDLPMDDWEPSSTGETTLRQMRESFQQYYNRQDVHAYFRKCAAELVTIRRARVQADPSFWERYALGTTYTCRETHCKYEPDMTWEYKDMFKTHLRNDHNLTADADTERACRSGTLRWEYKGPEVEAAAPAARRANTSFNGFFSG